MVLGCIVAWDEVAGGSPAGWTFDLLGIVLGEKAKVVSGAWSLL
jgi:hypothetical protein